MCYLMMLLSGVPESYGRGVTLNNIWGENKWEKHLKCFGTHHHIISSMHGWRKVVYYLIMPLDMAKRPTEGE